MSLNKETNHGFEYQDVPEIETSMTSSIGGLWPPEKGSFGRIKAFYNESVVNDHPHAMRIAQEFIACLKNDDETSRVQFRFLAEGRLLRQLSSLELFRNHVEALVELDPGVWGNEPVMVYMSANAKSRQGDVNDLNRVFENNNSALNVSPKKLDEIFNRTKEFNVGILNIPEDNEEFENLLDQVSNLYSRFGWSRNDVAEILNNKNNLFAVAFDGNQIVSAAIAEFAQIPFQNNQNLEIVEITEAATLNEHQNKGLYNTVSTTLMLEITRQIINGRQIDLVFGECNGLSQGVLTVAKQQGRCFATENGAKYGFPETGILIQQVPISGPVRHTDYNDLIPAYFTRTTLLQRYGDYVNKKNS